MKKPETTTLKHASRRGASFEGEIQIGSTRSILVGWTEIDAGTSDYAVDIDYLKDPTTGNPINSLDPEKPAFNVIIDEILRGKVEGRPRN